MQKKSVRRLAICATSTAVLGGLALGASAIVGAERMSILSMAASAGTLDPAKVSRGRYITKIAGCNDCHTDGYIANVGHVDESRWLAGSALGFQGPWGTTYPANLRQLIQGMTESQWLEHARRPTRPPMPWFALRDMSDADLSAMYHFVRSLGPVEREVPAFVPPGGSVNTPVVKFPQ